MEKTTGEMMLTEMNTFLSANASAETESENALPFETLDEYSTDPLQFADVTAKLFQKVSAVFDLAVKYNRHSSEYLKSCTQLEKGIKYLGSSCLQKYALEQKKHTFPELAKLNTTNLYIMASIHFQKIDRALTEYMEQKKAVDDALLDMEYRYYHLMERLRATEVKIRSYDHKLFYGQEDYKPVAHGLAFSEKSWTKDLHKNDEPLAFQRARAFSVNADGIVNAERRMQKEELSAPVVSENEEMHREQFSRTDSHRHVADEMRKEINTSISAPEQADDDLQSQNVVKQVENKGPEKDTETTEKEVPLCVQILQQAAFRSRLRNLDYLAFTEKEMRLLTADPLFYEIEPKMAAEMRQALEEHDSG